MTRWSLSFFAALGSVGCFLEAWNSHPLPWVYTIDGGLMLVVACHVLITKPEE